MHEFSIVSEMIEKISKIKQEQKWIQVTRVQLKMGVLSGVERQAIENCFEILTKEWSGGSPVLDIIIEPVEFHCSNCCKESLLETTNFICSDCGATVGSTHGGRNLYFSEMEGL